MNPAFSVVIFTTLIGAAQGLVVTLAVAALGGIAVSPAFQSSALLLALAMSVVGLGASFLHLGRPERAWRAVLMWRTSWLSREVILLPLFIAAVALWWLFPANRILPVVVVAFALLLWLCTAMIYACLRFIQEWAHPLTLINYTLIGQASGLLLACACAACAGETTLLRGAGPWALFFTFLATASRAMSLIRNARLVPKSTLQSATGIRSERLVQTSMGMSAGAFNTREFFHGKAIGILKQVKWAFLICAFALPALLMLWGVNASSMLPWCLALIIQIPGLIAERWFFFAQARHPQNLYYQVVS